MDANSIINKYKNQTSLRASIKQQEIKKRIKTIAQPQTAPEVPPEPSLPGGFD